MYNRFREIVNSFSKKYNLLPSLYGRGLGVGLFVWFGLGCHADTPLTIEGTVTKDISKQNTSSTYITFSTPIRMLEGSNLILKTARYTYITSTVTGEGRIDIYSGGERTYIGGSDKKSPDWSKFKGDVHIWPYKDLSASNGFYGLMWMHNGKTRLTGRDSSP